MVKYFWQKRRQAGQWPVTVFESGNRFSSLSPETLCGLHGGKVFLLRQIQIVGWASQGFSVLFFCSNTVNFSKHRVISQFQSDANSLYNLYTTVYHSMLVIDWIGISGNLWALYAQGIPMGVPLSHPPGLQLHQSRSPGAVTRCAADPPRPWLPWLWHPVASSGIPGPWRTPGTGIRLGSWTSWGIPDCYRLLMFVSSRSGWLGSRLVPGSFLRSLAACCAGINLTLWRILEAKVCGIDVGGMCRRCWDTSMLSFLVCVYTSYMQWYTSFHMKICWGVTQLTSSHW